MKTSRLIALTLAALLLLGMYAQAEPAYPAMRGNVNDDAFVLSDQTVQDIERLNARCEPFGLRFVVVTRHFLGGKNAQSYCDGLFDAWYMDGQSVLLLLVVGEERYAMTCGANIQDTLSANRLNTLLSANLRTPFLTERDYDGAVSSFLLAVTESAASAWGVDISTAGLLGSPEDAAKGGAAKDDADGFTFSDFGVNWWSDFFTKEGYTEQEVYEDYSRVPSDTPVSTKTDTGFSTGKLILILIAITILAKRSRRRARR